MAGWTPVFASPETTPQGESIASFFRLAGWELLRFAQLADFYVGAGRIDCHLLDPRYEFLVELRLLGPVLAYWLERSGLPVLHASAVAVDGRVAAFLAGSTGGKSSLAAALVAAGHPLVSDDLVAVDVGFGTGFFVRPSYPEMRLWPETAGRFVAEPELLLPLHPGTTKRRVPVGHDGFGTFAEDARPLARIYLPERSGGDAHGSVRFTPLSPRDALIELLRGSFVSRLAAAAGWQRRRLEIFASLVERVTVKRLLYPDDLDHLPRVRDAILADLGVG
jgi:hypothetical protein